MSTDKQSSLTCSLKQSFEPKQNKKKATPKYSYNRNKSNEPKRNKSAFVIFSNKTRAKLKEQGQPKLNPNEMIIKLAEMWKNLSKEERKPYEEEARLDKIRYCEELENFWKDNPSRGLNNKTKANYVKKPCTAYALFLKDIKDEVKAENPGVKMADIFKLISNKWKTLDQSNKAIYQAKAKKEKEEAKNRLSEHYSKNGGSKEDYEKKNALRLYWMRRKIKRMPVGNSITESPEKRSDYDNYDSKNEVLLAKASAYSDFNDCSPTVESSALTPKSNRDFEVFQFEDTPKIINEKIFDFVDEIVSFDSHTVSVKNNDDVDFSGKNLTRTGLNPFTQALELELEIPPLDCTLSKMMISQNFQNIFDFEDFPSNFVLTQINNYANFISQKLS